MIETTKYARKPFYVDAVQVTAENINEVAEWCSGEVVQSTSKKGAGGVFIKVPVQRPMNERQTKAFVGDWVLSAGSGFKVYKDTAFKDGFESSDDGRLVVDVDWRDAKTGQFVTKEYAEENPDTTVGETNTPQAHGDALSPFEILPDIPEEAYAAGADELPTGVEGGLFD